MAYQHDTVGVDARIHPQPGKRMLSIVGEAWHGVKVVVVATSVTAGIE